MQENSLTKSAKILLWATALMPIVLFAAYMFPYVTVRTLFFRMLAEGAALLWLWLWLKGQVRPLGKKQAYFGVIFVALLLVEIVAAIFGESPVVSFFSDFERSWGIFTVAHLMLFYILARIFFNERDWRIFWHLSFGASLWVCVYGWIQRFPGVFKINVFQAGVGRITSTLGNPAYVAIYLVFNAALAAFFACRAAGKKRVGYLVISAINLATLTLTEIRGVYLGLVAGVILAALLYVILGSSARRRQAVGAVLGAGALILLFGFFNPENALVKKIPILSRLSSISIEDVTAQTRFIGWNAAWQGFKERPLLGVGMENYNVVFNKHLQARYYNLASAETFFDRAHNQYLNLLAESGIFALLIYFCLPIVLGYYLWRGWRQGKFTLAEWLVLVVAGVAYFTHVFFVFDDFNSFLMLAAFLGLVEFRFFGGAAENQSIVRPGGFKKIIGWSAIVFVLFSLYSLNLKPLQAANLAAQGYMAEVFETKIKYFNYALDLNTLTAENIVSNYIDYLVTLIDSLDQLKADSARAQLMDETIQKVAAALRQEISRKPSNAFLYLKAVKLDTLSFMFYQDRKYFEAAEADALKGIALSPERIQFHFVLGETYILADEPEKARDILEQALALNQEFPESYYYLGRAYLATGEIDKGYDFIINQAIGSFGYAPPNDRVLLLLAQEYLQKNDYVKLVRIYEELWKTNKKNVSVAASLAAAYIQLDRFDEAAAMVEEAVKLDSSFSSEAAWILEKIQKGQFQELKESTR
jgi:O-antigen ligase